MTWLKGKNIHKDIVKESNKKGLIWFEPCSAQMGYKILHNFHFNAPDPLGGRALMRFTYRNITS